MCFENPIIHGFRYESLHVSVLDDGNQFTVEISEDNETYTVEIGNTKSDSPLELVSYMRTGISFWLNDLEEGRYEGPLEERENILLDLWNIFDDWTLATHVDDGSYYKRTLAGDDESPIIIYLKTEDPEELATDYSLLVFQSHRAISRPDSMCTVLPKAMIEAIAFATKRCQRVCA